MLRASYGSLMRGASHQVTEHNRRPSRKRCCGPHLLTAAFMRTPHPSTVTLPLGHLSRIGGRPGRAGISGRLADHGCVSAASNGSRLPGCYLEYMLAWCMRFGDSRPTKRLRDSSPLVPH
ncbi:hypothetical protein HaLaN_30387 [Haematococcus lacustris]|uniref:Uncharacterized protein n=1 Tax=Haematococcus lacustris TaxID=44745 RepID=A0A6A0AFD5_HAELA|nr:hypothetical protein HaLaN_30387 [Haematococcus lacustris]